MKSRVFKKFVSLLLVLVFSTQLVTPALAAVIQNEDGSLVLTDENGNVIEKDWEAEFPYGTFVFENSQLTTAEGDGEKSIKIYRLGGTVGKADITVTVAPVLSQMDDESYSASTAACFYDYVMMVEDTLPIAAYQAYGQDAQPLAAKDPATISAEEVEPDTVDGEGDPVYGHTVLSLSVTASKYLWQAKNADGMWSDVGTEETLDVDNDVLELGDIRCIYTVRGQRYCSTSYKGEVYEPDDDDLPAIPEDLERNPEKSFTVLDPEKYGITPYGTYEFTMTFAEGESVKEIRILPVDDDEAENVELLALRISACKGGELYDTANTLAISIEDNEEQQPSFFAFETTDITVDKAAGTAELTVRRTGALQYVTSVDYHTEDGTAIAGEDYSYTEGQLCFSTDMDEMTIEIPLINNGEIIAEEDSDLSFTVVLDNPIGGSDSAVVEGKDTARVKLYNSGESETPNLATMLYTPEADDVSGNTQTTGAIAPSGSDTVIAQPVTQESADVGFSFGGDGDISALTYDLSATLKFNRATMPTSTHWTDRAALDGSLSSGSVVNDTQGLSYNGWDDYGQVSKQSDGYMGRYSGAVGRSNNRYLKWNKQTVENFDQLFTDVYAVFRGKTENNSLHQYHTTSSTGLTSSTSGKSLDQINNTVSFVKSGSAGNYSNVSKTIPVVKGSAGLFIALGSEDVGWADTRDAGGSVYLKAEAARRVLTGNIRYLIHTADDDTITAADRASLYDAIAPSISVESGDGGVDKSGHVYVGTELTLKGPIYSSYQYITTESGKTPPLYLTNSAGKIVNTGTVGENKSATLKLVGSNGWTFAEGGNLSTSDDYTVNVVLNRVQKINVNVAPSVPRNAEGNLDGEKIDETVDAFFDNANIELSYKVSQNPEKGTNGQYTVPFKTANKYLGANDFSNTSTTLTSNGTVENLQYINFHLPHTDQILFNGEAYAGDAQIPISLGMFGMENLTFTYYASDYVSVESDMTLSIGRIEHYIDYNGNGKIDGELTSANQFILTPVKIGDEDVYDVLVEVLDEDQYNITEFLPVFGSDGQPVQHFLKFYYNMTPRCLSVPAGYKAEDPAQILPSFVTSITDSAALSALSREMQGFRFIDSGVYTDETNVYNNSGIIVKTHEAGSYSGDGKLMFGAAANAVETVDVPMGGDCGTPTPTYIYMDGKGDEHETKDKPSVVTNDPDRSDWFLADAKFLREDWYTDYRGNLLYEFHDPAAVFISDPLYGDMLPVAAESADYSSGYDAEDTNLYLGSFNPNDTVALCIRPQAQTTEEIHEFYDLKVGSGSVSTLGETIESGEYRISVDSVNPAGFKTVPDGSNLRVMTSPDAGSTQGFDSSASSGAFSEFNMDMGIELPSLSFAVTDYVTLIIDGDEIGFSIGVPLASCSKETDYHTDFQNSAENNKLYSFTHTTKGEWETGNPVSENIDQAQGILDNLNPKGEQWKSIKAAQHANMKRDSRSKPILDHGYPQYNDKLIKSSSQQFSMAVNVTVMFKYSPVDNTYHFTSAMVFLQFGFEYRKEVRLSCCPIIYAYVVIGVSLEVAGGVINEREVVEVGQGDTGYIDINSPTSQRYELSSNANGEEWRIDDQDGASGKRVANGAPGCSIEFICKSDAFNAYFSGTLKIEKKTGSDETSWECLGYIRSDGSEPVLVMLDEKVNGSESADIPVRITVLDARAEVDTIVAIEKIRNDTYFSGLSLTPCAYMEVGAGIGVECLKAEIYFKASISITMSFFTRQNNAATKGSNLRDPSSSSVSVMGAAASVVSSDDTVSAFGGSEVEPFSFDNFKFRAGLGVRVVLLFFNFEMDMIQFGIDYSKEYDMNRGGDDGSEDGFKHSGWKFAWYAFNETTDVATYGLDDEDEGFPGIKITIPANTFTAQQIFGPEYADQVMDEIEALAFDPENLADKSFQISGYSSSGDAFCLAEGLGSGADYQLLTVGDANYLLYTISRDPKNIQNAVDSNMLVLSKIQNTGVEENIGLVNPVNPDSETAYIVVDNDNTGDLDFSGQVNGNTIYVSWVSYALETAANGSTKPTMPDAAEFARPSYTDSNGVTVYMNNVNYEETAFKPVEPTLSVSEPTAPKQTDYYLTADQFGELGEEQQLAYTQDTESGNYYNASTYETYAAAKGAYDDAYAQYATDKAAYDAAKEEYDAEYQNYSSLKAAYDAWHDYYAGNATASASTQELLANSAHNTVIKTASFTVGTDNGFTVPEVLADATDGGYKFLPAVSPDGKLTFFARSKNYTDSEKDDATDKAKAYYDASKGDVSTDATGLSTGSGDPSAAFRYAYTTSTDDIYGKNTQFYFSYQTDDGNVVTTGWTPDGWEEAGMRLSSVDMVMLDGTNLYLAYTATRTVTSVNGTSYSDANVHKLYLQKGSVDTTTGAVTLETAKMLRTLVDLNESGGGDAMISSLTGTTGVSQDGVYRNTDGTGLQLVEEHKDPYFGTVKFLRGDLGDLTGDGDPETFGESLSFVKAMGAVSLFLLFEMNGTAYVVPEASLASITDSSESSSSGTGYIIPFFAPTEENSGRGSMDIGVDGDGNISAVYTSTVPYTTNNAIYVSKYDANTQKFGEGRMLAMNQMQVYEDSIANCWNAEETEQAYYGKLEGYKTDDRGLMTSFTFSDLAVALGLTKTTETSEGTGSSEGSEGTVTAANTAKVDESTLVILARGTKTELEETEFYGETGTKIVTSKYNNDGTMATATGIYVLSFGVGEKSVGEASITFESPNFVTGARLRPVVSFKNTGDVSLRGSETDPITVQLCISGPDGNGAGEELFKWEINENIAVGQTVTTQLNTGDSTKTLPKDLVGRKIYFTVSEDTGYVDSPLEYSSLDGGVVREIESKPELAVENLKFSTLGVETVGSEQMVKIGVSMKVTNRGAANAVAPYIQFAYQSGRTMEEVKEGDTDYQKAVYTPLDITHSSFEIGKQTPIDSIEAASADDPDKKNGILRLVGTDTEEAAADRKNLQAGCERTVSGTILVPKDAYCLATATGSLNLVVSVFDDNTSISSLSADGLLVSAFDNEYVPDNNASYDSLEPTSFFSAPQKLTIPLGTTMRLALPVTTTEQTVPVIEVNELNCQAQATNESHMGILYYNMGSSGTGADGYLVLSPSDEGSGIIRVADKNTNAWVDISYTVTEAGSGVNIFKDNGRFTWYNAKGQLIDPETDESGAWVFQSAVAQWGTGEETTVPYLGDTSNAKMRNTSFTFDTLAETIDLYFDGSIQVSCNDEDVETQNFTATGGKGEKSYATINLGSNPANKTRRITVKVTSDSAVFDYMVEHFAGNLPIMPDIGGDAPQIYFSRVMPETASLDPAEYPDGFPVTVYIVDENGLAQATLDPGSSNAATANYSAPNDNFRQFDVVVKKNGTFAVSATDTTGNTSSRTIMADWFNSPVSVKDEPLVMQKNWVYLDSDKNTIEIADNAMLKKNQFAYLDVSTMIGSDSVDAKTTLEYYQVTTTTVTTTYELVEKEIPGETEEAPVTTAWFLQKTVTTVDEKGNLVDTEITETPAEETTVVPAGSVSVETRGEWEPIDPVQIGETEPKTTLYPVVQNGIYKLTAERNEKYANELFLMNRLNSDLPSIRLGYVEAENVLSAPSITYSAAKGESSIAGLASIQLLGKSGNYVIATADNADVMKGSVQVLYSGSYTLIAVDGAGNEQYATKEIEDISLMAQNGAITVNAATNNDRNNGSISIDASKLMGGNYDSIDAAGVHNVYQIALIPSAENYNGTADGFGAFANGLTWKGTELGDVSFEDLAPGVYCLYVRDAVDTPDPANSTEEDYLIRKLTVNDHSVNFTTATTSSSITVKATGAEQYEYIVFPLDGTEMTAYSEIDELIEQSRTAAEGNAQAAKAAAVAQAQKDLASAVEARDSIADKESEEYKAAQEAVEEAEKQLEAMNRSDISSFIDQNELIEWKNTNYFPGLTRGQQYQVVVRDAADVTRYKAALVTAVSPSGGGSGLGNVFSGESFTEKEEAEIIQKNQADDVMIENEKYIVIIPQGTLKSGDSVNSLLLTVPSDLSITDDGIVVSCTAADGSTYIVPWCVVENEKVLYLALEPGDYALVNNPKHFSDIDSHWAKTYIDFVTARELFKGTDENVFSPNLTMTRAMFVTVLGRMANVDTANYDGSTFRDVPKNFWCGAYVEWAADNGIVSGYGDGSFRPNNPVTREQMAKILYNFARLMGEEVTGSGNLSRYTDQTHISEWAIDPCSWATDCGLLQGREDGSFNPSGEATRGEVSALLKRFINHTIQRIFKAGSNN